MVITVRCDNDSLHSSMISSIVTCELYDSSINFKKIYQSITNLLILVNSTKFKYEAFNLPNQISYNKILSSGVISKKLLNDLTSLLQLYHLFERYKLRLLLNYSFIYSEKHFIDSCTYLCNKENGVELLIESFQNQLNLINNCNFNNSNVCLKKIDRQKRVENHDRFVISIYSLFGVRKLPVKILLNDSNAAKSPPLRLSKSDSPKGSPQAGRVRRGSIDPNSKLIYHQDDTDLFGHEDENISHSKKCCLNCFRKPKFKSKSTGKTPKFYKEKYPSGTSMGSIYSEDLDMKEESPVTISPESNERSREEKYKRLSSMMGEAQIKRHDWTKDEVTLEVNPSDHILKPVLVKTDSKGSQKLSRPISFHSIPEIV